MSDMENESRFQDEVDILDDYLFNIYARRVSPPVEPKERDLSFWKIVGIESFLYGISGIVGMLFSALRTGFLFYIVEKLLVSEFNLGIAIEEGLGLGMAITALLAFEGSLAAKGFNKGKMMSEARDSKLATGMAFIVILSGGAFSSFSLVDGLISPIKIWFYLAIALVMAIAGAIIVYYGAENVGFMFVRHEQEKFRILRDYRGRYDDWRKSGESSFWSSKHGKNFKKNEQLMNTSVQNSSNEQGGSEHVQFLFKKGSNLSKQELAYEYVSQFYDFYGRIPSTNEAMNDGMFSKGYASYAVNDFMIANSKILMDDKAITQEQMLRAVETYQNRNSVILEWNQDEGAYFETPNK